MRDYELIFVARPDITDEDVGTVRLDVKNLVEKHEGSIEKENLWGKRQLAFEVKDFTEGTYTMFNIKLPPSAAGLIKEQLRIDERIIRYILTLRTSKKKLQ